MNNKRKMPLGALVVGIILASGLTPDILARQGALANTAPAQQATALDQTPVLDSANNCITREEIVSVQKDWGDRIVLIGEVYTNNGDYQAFATELVNQLYDYDESTVLFKPTKASVREFRLRKEEAISYFVTGVIPEDEGFALQPWSQVRFKNAGMLLNCDSAITMGDYYFKDAKTGEEVKAEYTFGYRKNEEGELLINLHHSSFPYQEAN